MNALVAVVLAASAPGNVTSIDGVTKDGRYLVWTGQDDYESPGATVVQDLWTGARTVFGQELGEDGPKDSDKLQKWKAAHPLVEVRAGRTSPDKQAVADVVSVEVTGSGGWNGDTWSSGSSSGWNLVVKRGGTQQVAAKCDPASAVEVYWTPDGKRTIWVVGHRGRAMRDPGYDDLIIGTDGNPGVAVAVDKAKLRDAEKLSAPFAKAGFTVLSLTPAVKAREKSVVFAAAGHEADAKKLAAAVPGGADVQKLDWKSQVDLVVALGPEALK
jgi:hypothetical protein